MYINPALGRLRQENQKFETNLDYIAKLCLKKLKGKGPGSVPGLVEHFPSAGLCVTPGVDLTGVSGE